MKLALQLLTYNGSHYIAPLLESLANQNDCDFMLFIAENSTEEKERVLTRGIVNSFRDRINIEYIENEENNGFAGGHQQLFELHGASYVCLVNQDMVLRPRCIAKKRASLERDESLGAVTCVVERAELDEGGQLVGTGLIDTAGLKFHRTGKVIDHLAGEHIDCAEGLSGSADGSSGSLVMLRRDAVERSSESGQLFDPKYGSYKEDVDLALRMKRAGFETRVLPEHLALHRRSFRKSITRGDNSYTQKYFSYRNHIWNLLSHLRGRDLLIDGLFIAMFEISKAVYILFSNPSILWRTFRDTLEYLPRIRRKRAYYAKGAR